MNELINQLTLFI